MNTHNTTTTIKHMGRVCSVRQAKDTGRRNHAVANSEHEGIHSPPNNIIIRVEPATK